ATPDIGRRQALCAVLAWSPDLTSGQHLTESRTVVTIDYLIIGGGLAGVSAAETLRAIGARGSVAIVSGEIDPPHDRPPLSKEFLRDERSREQVLLRPLDFYQSKRIGLVLGRPALALKPESHEVLLADGETIGYQRLLLATGGRPRTIGVPGESLPGIYQLRTLAEAERLKEAAGSSTRVVVVGASFIGLEVAASLTERGLDVTVLNQDDQIWPNVVPAEIASAIQADFEARGVVFRHSVRVTAFEGKDSLEYIITNAGDVEASFAVVGVGLQLNTELAAAAGLEVDDGIVVNDRLQTSIPGIFAAGDVASFPDVFASLNGEPRRRHVEHWDNAVTQGKVAGANMAGKRIRFQHVPYFWSDLFEHAVNVVGSLDGAEIAMLRGTIESRKCTYLALRGGYVRGALMLNRAGDRRALTDMIGKRIPIEDHLEQLADPSFRLADLLLA
ncbi:MAG TPA: FAD-dependent oxidoreductase, partial [Chloroflexota bacterium]|nr:FAD-dependent oxidoreductase [Chloroflexota bacterium]